MPVTRRSARPAATLNKALASIPVPARPPHPLPAAHLTKARWFRTIVDDCALQPTACRVFGRDVLYLYYGGVLYRHKTPLTGNPHELPIALLFGPSVLDQADQYYPFDTGAMADQRFGKVGKSMHHFKSRFRVAGAGTYRTAQRIIHNVFGTNERYRRGEVDPACARKPDPFPTLHRFLSTDLAAKGVDHRQYSLEIQFAHRLQLDRDLLWIGYPKRMKTAFARLCRKLEPHVPDSYTYDYHRPFAPAQIAAVLEDRAQDVVKRFQERP